MTKPQLEIRILPENKQGWFLGYTRCKVGNFVKFPLIEFWEKRGVTIDPEKRVCKIKYHKGRKGKIYFYPCEMISLPHEPQKRIDAPEYHRSFAGVLLPNK